MKRLSYFATVFAVSALVVVSVARADEVVVVQTNWDPAYARSHFYMGGEAVGNVMLGQLGGGGRFIGHGGGPNFFLGGRVNRVLALEFGFAPGFYDSNNPSQVLGRDVHNGLALTQLTFDFKVFPMAWWIQPYFAVGPSLNFLSDWEGRYLAAGPGWQIGGGVDFWVLPVLSLGFKTQYRGTSLVNYDASERSTYLSMMSFAFNVTGRF